MEPADLNTPLMDFLSARGLTGWLKGQGHFSVFDFEPETTVGEFLAGTCEDMLAYPGDLVLSVLVAMEVWPESPEWISARLLVESEYPSGQLFQFEVDGCSITPTPAVVQGTAAKDARRSALLFAENVAAFRRIMAGQRNGATALA